MKTCEKGNERLLKVCEVLGEVEKKDFNLACFHRPDCFGCGYVACAIGHAMLHPWFNKRGFKPTIPNDSQSQWLRICGDYYQFHKTPSYKGKEGVEACLNFFEIEKEKFKELFTLSGYENDDGEYPERVASKIKRFVKTRT